MLRWFDKSLTEIFLHVMNSSSELNFSGDCLSKENTCVVWQKNLSSRNSIYG